MLDRGHGQETPGKRSPDSSLIEWQYCDEIAKRIQKELLIYGWDTRLVCEDSKDVSLSKRASIVNEVCDKYGVKNVILISIHCNAASDDGKWHNGKGWECWTTLGQTNSDKLASELYKASKYYLPNTQLRVDWTDGDEDKEKNFTLLYKTKCPAVITENLFMDNKNECDFLLSEIGKQTIVDLHIDGILKYMQNYMD